MGGRKVIAEHLPRIDPRYPITKTLANIFGAYKEGNSKVRVDAPKKETHDRRQGLRTEVISEKLCGK